MWNLHFGSQIGGECLLSFWCRNLGEFDKILHVIFTSEYLVQWPTQPLAVYSTINFCVKALAPFIESVRGITQLPNSETTPVTPLDNLAIVISTGLLPDLHGLLEEIYSRPTSLSFGSFGISLFYQFLRNLQLAILGLPAGMPATPETRAVIQKLLTISTAFNAAVFQFRTDRERTQYDPKGFSAFSIALESKQAMLGVSHMLMGLTR